VLIASGLALLVKWRCQLASNAFRPDEMQHNPPLEAPLVGALLVSVAITRVAPAHQSIIGLAVSFVHQDLKRSVEQRIPILSESFSMRGKCLP
jgi:hypothetical protein